MSYVPSLPRCLLTLTLFQITRRFSHFLNRRPWLETLSDETYGGLLGGKVGPLVLLLEAFFKEMSVRTMEDCNEAALRTALTVFWSNQPGGSLSELSLLVNPLAQPGESRFGFLDLFLPCSPRAPCIEFKNISLDALWQGQYDPKVLSSDMSLEALREQLRQESDEQLLERRLEYGREKPTTIKDVKTEAFEQITRYLNVMKDGVASTTRCGVHDSRVKHTEEECELIGYVVILVGGTRALVWRVTAAHTQVTWEITEDFLVIPLTRTYGYS
jgi:hypothetical protein